MTQPTEDGYTVVLLQLDQPTLATGNIYPADVVKKALDAKGDYLLAEYGLPSAKVGEDPSAFYRRVLGIDPDRVCAKISDIRIENNQVLGTVKPFGPKQHLIDPAGRFALRAMTKLDDDRTVTGLTLVSFDYVVDGVRKEELHG